MGKLATAFKEAFGLQDVAGGIKMHVDHVAVISKCMMNLGLMMGLPWRKNPMPTPPCLPQCGR
jgi:hypothetical protein